VFFASLFVILALLLYYFVLVTETPEQKLYYVKSLLDKKRHSRQHLGAQPRFDDSRLDLAHVEYLITLVNIYLENNQLQDAARVYPQLMDAYRGMPRELKPALFYKCLSLHQRIHELSREDKNENNQIANGDRNQYKLQ